MSGCGGSRVRPPIPTIVHGVNPPRHSNPDWLLALQAVHPHQIIGSSVQPSPFTVSSGDKGEIVVSGEVDWECQDAFRLALGAGAACGPETLVIDLAGLAFIDLSGL